MATTEQVEQIVKLFIGYFNRAPAPGGTNYWTGRFEASGEGPAMTWAEIAESFSVQNETTTLYPIMETRDFSKESIESFLNSVFQNLFGRDIRDAGLTYYSNQLTSTDPDVQRTIGEIILDIINGAVDGPDKARIDNKVAVSVDFFNKTNAIEGFVFDDAARAVATDLLTTVTSDPATVAPAIAKTTAYIDDIGGSQPGVTVNLTPFIDQPGGGGNGADTQGTSGADSYTATVQTTDSTLQSTDIIAAGDGVDTLTVRVISISGGQQTVAPVATGLENIVVNNQATSGDFRLNFQEMSGETEVTAAQNAASAETRFINLDMDTKIRIIDNDGLTIAHFKGDRSASTTDRIDLYVEDSGTETSSAIFITSNEASNAVDRSFEIAEIEIGGTTQSFLDLNNMTLDSVMVTGTQTLTLEDTTANFATLKSADASGMTGGGLNLDASSNTQTAFSFLGSAQDDMLLLNRSLFNNSNTLSLDGGGGDTDVLAVESFNNLNATSVNAANNFEVLQATGSTTGTINASAFTKIDNFIFAGQTTNQSRLTIEGITGNDNFIFTSDQGQTDETVRFSGQNAGTSMRFELRADTATNGEVRIVANTNSGNDVAAIGFGNGNISAVQIISSGSNANANVIRAVDSGSNMYYAFDNQNGPTNFTVSGGQALTITAEAGVNLNASSDERGFESAVNLDGSNATGALRIAGSGSSDVLIGGSGDDIIYGMGGDNVLTGNDGSDQFRFSNFSGSGQLQDFTIGEDKIGLQRVDFQNTTASSAGTILNTNDYVENVSSISQLSAAESNKVIELQLGASQTQITQTTGGASNAYVLVFNTTSGKGELWFDSNWSDTSSRTLTATFETITDLVGLTGLSNTEFVEYTF